MNEPKVSGEFLSYKEICRRYHIGRTTLYRWIEAGSFPKAFKFGQRCSRWSLAELKEWEDKNKGAEQ